jgi:hypothetical protein
VDKYVGKSGHKIRRKGETKKKMAGDFVLGKSRKKEVESVEF